MSDNVTWTPVEDEWDDESCGGTSSIGWDGKVISIVQDGEMMWHAPASDIRICRATPAPQWSQDVPTEPGDYWLWYPDEGRMVLENVVRTNLFPDLRLYDESADYYESSKEVFHAERVYRPMPSDTWWLPAHVPAPPVT